MSTISRNIAVAGALYVIGLLALVSLAATSDRCKKPAPAPDPAAFIPALLNSKTIRVTATCFAPDASGRLVKNSRMSVTFARPYSFRVEEVDLSGSATHQEEPDIFVTDGSTCSEYLAETNSYRTATIPAERPVHLSPLTGVERKALTAEIPNGFQRMFTPLVSESITVKTIHMGRKPIMLVDRNSRPAPGSSETIVGRRLWYDWKTGLPVRYETYLIAHGKEVIHQRIEYTNWAIDETVAASTFTWKAPWNAVAYQCADTYTPVTTASSAQPLSAVASSEQPAGATTRQLERKPDFRNSGSNVPQLLPLTVSPQKVPAELTQPIQAR